MKRLQKTISLMSVLLLLGTSNVALGAGTTQVVKSGNIEYRTQVQNVGWQQWVGENEQSGTSGKSLRLEGIEIKVTGLPDKAHQVGVTYRTHVENMGWQERVSDGETSGTVGRGLRLEAIQIALTGTDAEKYDVYYRVHAQNVGWMGWATNGEAAGTAGFGYRLEAIQIQLKQKSEASPIEVGKAAFKEYVPGTDSGTTGNNGGDKTGGVWNGDLGATPAKLTDDVDDYADGISN